MSTVTLSKPHCAIISAEKPEGIASQAFTTALPWAQICLTLFGIDRVSFCRFFKMLAGRPPDRPRAGRALSPSRYHQARARGRRSGAHLGMTAEIGGADGFVAP